MAAVVKSMPGATQGPLQARTSCQPGPCGDCLLQKPWEAGVAQGCEVTVAEAAIQSDMATIWETGS